jgi:phosphate transport system substrate-binding protein
MFFVPMASTRPVILVLVVALVFTGACSGGAGLPGAASAGPRSSIRITGSDTMINLVQAFAETYHAVRPDVSIQVAGGGSGVGIAGLIDGILEIAAAGRQITAQETQSVRARRGTEPREFVVALDALAVYVHRDNPLGRISLDDLAEVYGDGGSVERWSQLGIRNERCRRDAIVRIGRQNSSGTYTYFREAVLGPNREYKLGSIDQNGSKDVVTLVSRTPCAIGYSGMAFALPGVRALAIAATPASGAVAPTVEAARDGSYPLARPLYFYTPGEPGPSAREFIEWVRGPAGQEIVARLGFVAVNGVQPSSRQQGSR